MKQRKKKSTNPPKFWVKVEKKSKKEIVPTQCDWDDFHSFFTHWIRCVFHRGCCCCCCIGISDRIGCVGKIECKIWHIRCWLIVSCNWKPIVSYEKKKTSIGNFVFGSLFGFCLISGNSLVFFNVSCKIIFHSRTSIAIEIVKMFTINVNGFDKRNSKNLAGVRKLRIIDWRTENENFPFISLWEKSIRQEIRLNARGRKRMERMKDFVCRHL